MEIRDEMAPPSPGLRGYWVPAEQRVALEKGTHLLCDNRGDFWRWVPWRQGLAVDAGIDSGPAPDPSSFKAKFDAELAAVRTRIDAAIDSFRDTVALGCPQARAESPFVEVAYADFCKVVEESLFNQGYRKEEAPIRLNAPAGAAGPTKGMVGMVTGVDATLAERGARYGRFADHALLAQDLREAMRERAGWGRLAPDQKQALETIQDKVARILNGDPDYDDNWRDIAGYATLVLNRLLEEQAATDPYGEISGPAS